MSIMQNLIESLKTRYEAVLQSSSDSQFYMNIHAYIDLIRKNPSLSKIMDDSENEYRKQHIAIWPDKSKTDKEADEREQRSIRLEKFNLYTAHFCWLEARIYDPIEDYKKTDAPDDEQDPVALLIVKGIKNIKTKKWSEKTLRLYNKWFDGKRGEYENDLRQFHADFLTKIQLLKAEKVETKPEPEKEKLPLILSSSTGDFSFYNFKGNLVPTGQEFKVLNTLLNSSDFQASYLSLLQSFNPYTENATKTSKQELYLVINGIKGQLKILPQGKNSNLDIFKNVRGFGYRLVFQDKEKKLEKP